jgi:hypothetical protein
MVFDFIPGITSALKMVVYIYRQEHLGSCFQLSNTGAGENYNDAIVIMKIKRNMSSEHVSQLTHIGLCKTVIRIKLLLRV